MPNELVLQVFSHVETLDQLHAVMLTCKRFNRISRDVSAKHISNLALRTGNCYPGLLPLSHFLLVAVARRLSQWAVRANERRRQLKNAMHGGIEQLAAFALSIVPISLHDICTTWQWKKDIVDPLSRRVDELVAACEDPEQALFLWAIHGELFGRLPASTSSPLCEPLDSVTRFKFVVFCIPSVKSFQYLSIEEPEWFNDDERGAERFQQLSLTQGLFGVLTSLTFFKLSLRQGLFGMLNSLIFSAEIRELAGISIPADYDLVEHSADSREYLFIQSIMSSGRRSLEILQTAYQVKLGRDDSSEALVLWLREIWALVGDLARPERRAELQKSLCLEDDWLSVHVPSLALDSQFTLEGDLMYPLRIRPWSTQGEAHEALKKAIASECMAKDQAG